VLPNEFPVVGCGHSPTLLCRSNSVVADMSGPPIDRDGAWIGIAVVVVLVILWMASVWLTG